MKTNSKDTALCIIASAVLLACSNQTAATPHVIPSSIATFPLTLISTPTHTATAISTSTPDMTPAVEVNSSQFCLGDITPWSCSCGDLSNDRIRIQKATQVGSCDVTVSIEDHQAGGYTITLPDNWFCEVVGVASNNLLCFSDGNKKIFLQSLITELPIAQADEALSVFQEGEAYWSDPVVETDEKKISRELVTSGDKQLLKLLTSQKNSFILRYFIKNEDSLYVLRFEIKDPDDQENKTTILILEDAVNSLQFIQ